MGVVRVIRHEDIELQSKNEPRDHGVYEVGSEIGLSDGIYFTLEGVFVVFKGKVVAVFDSTVFIRNKFDESLSFKDVKNMF